MQRVVRGIEMEDDQFGRLLVGIKEEIDEQAFGGGRVMTYLMITRRFGTAER
jgi:hypothetical protein